MRVEQLGGHRGPGPALGARRLDRRVLSERAAGRAVHVEVLEHDELRVRRLRRLEDSALEGRELFRPAVVVGRVEAEVDGAGVGRDLAGELEVGGVSADRFHSGDRRGAASVDHANLRVPTDERSGNSAARRARAEYDVRAGGHDFTAVAGTNAPMIMLCKKANVIAP